jgi:proteasome beta subunit
MKVEFENRHSILSHLQTPYNVDEKRQIDLRELIKTGTTIIAIEYEEDDGSRALLLGGDRRATAGNVIFSNEMQKIYRIDSCSYIGISGVVAVGMDFVNILRLELEHYRKIENRDLFPKGKAARLRYLIKTNLSAALQGLVAVPLFCTFSGERGYIFSYDVAGALYEEQRYHSIGSGSQWIKSLLRDYWSEKLTYAEAMKLILKCFIYVSENDSASYGVDIERNIYPDIVRLSKYGIGAIERDELVKQVKKVSKDTFKTL